MKANNRTLFETNETAAEAILDKPTPEEIAERAHSLYEADGSQHGKHVEHWVTAEADLLAERNI